MPWQRDIADVALEIDPVTKRLVYRQVTITVPRQSGKTTLILAIAVHRALAMGPAQNISYAAQTRIEARKKWEDDHLPELLASPFAKLLRVRKAPGNEAFIWRNGSRHGIVSATRKAGHGPVLDLAFIDEAFAQEDDRLEQAFKPSMVTRDQPQLYIVSTAGHALSLYLQGKVQAGRAAAEMGLNRGSAYLEYSAPEDADPADPATWWGCMPALGHTVREEAIAADFTSMKLGEFRRAYLNQWTDGLPEEWSVISEDAWRACADEESPLPGRPVAIALDVKPGEATGCIAVAGARDDGRVVGEIPRDCHRPGDGTSWMIPRALELRAKYRPCAIIIDKNSPAACLVGEAERAGLEFVAPTTAEVGQAFGLFWVSVADRVFCHLGNLQPQLRDAVKGAARRDIGDGAHAWARKNTSVDISPLCAVTMACWGFQKYGSLHYDLLRSVR